MTVEVRYYCPHCGTVATLDRDPYMADKSVTPYPLEGWTYAAPSEDYERDDVDGVRFVCGESDVEWDGEGCGKPFYLNFVRHEGGREVEPAPESEYVTLAEDAGPSAPQGPRGPGGPSGPGR